MNIKYYGDWKDTDNNLNRLEILTNKTVVNPTEIKLTYFKINSDLVLFDDDSLVGAGAEFGIVSKTKLEFLNELYAIGIKELKVIHYLNGTINYEGYLNTEVYSDDFYNGKNYEIELTSNNGILILDRTKFVNSIGKRYEGIKSAFNILKIILSKLDINYSALNIALSTTIPNYTLLNSENLLHKIFINTDNYIDEKGDIMNCREVLDSIFTPYTIKLFIQKNQVYCIDINSLAKENIEFKKYSLSGTYISTFTINNKYDINKIIDKHNITYTEGKSNVNVKFNKYVYDKLDFPINEDTVSEFIESIERNSSNRAVIYREDIYNHCEGYTLLNNKGVFVIRYNQLTGVFEDSFIRFNNSELTTNLELFKINTKRTVLSSRLFTQGKIEMAIEDLSNYREEKEGINRENFKNKGSFEIKNRIESENGEVYTISKYAKWQNNNNNFTKLGFADIDELGEEIYTKVNTFFSLYTIFTGLRWSLNILVPLNSDNSERRQPPETYTEEYSHRGGEYSYTLKLKNMPPSNYNIIFKPVTFSIEKKIGFGSFEEVESNDVEHKGEINSSYSNALNLDVIHGTDDTMNSRGGIMLLTSGLADDSDFAINERFINAKTFIRNNNEAELEELLINTYLSNLQQPRYVLNLSLEGYYDVFKLFNYDLIKRNNIPINMVGTSITTDYVNNITDIKLEEIIKDSL